MNTSDEKWAHASRARLEANPAGYARFKQDTLGISVHFGLYSIDDQIRSKFNC
jgi:hypothetical protein